MTPSGDIATNPPGADGELSQRRRTKAPETRAAALMEAAQRLFIDKGIAATSIDDIAAGAQVAKGTFYLYFPSKEALLGALQQRFVDIFCERLQEAMDRQRPGNYHARLRPGWRRGSRSTSTTSHCTTSSSTNTAPKTVACATTTRSSLS